MTTQRDRLSGDMVAKYMSNLTNRFYKILPIRESEPTTLQEYTGSLLSEMIGCQHLIDTLNHDDRYLTLLSILAYMTNHEMDVHDVRKEVFRAINIIKKLQEKYCANEVTGF